MTKFLITGPMDYYDKLKIRDMLFNIKKSFKEGEYLIIGGGLETGADRIIKNSCIELDMEYKEMPPSHIQWNMNCIGPKGAYGKKYNDRNFFIRNTKVLKIVDNVILFINENKNVPKFIYDLIKKSKENNKKILVIKNI